jgi:hypothetical protein
MRDPAKRRWFRALPLKNGFGVMAGPDPWSCQKASALQMMIGKRTCS